MWGILDITFKYVLEIITPVGWCLTWTFTNPCILLGFTGYLLRCFSCSAMLGCWGSFSLSLRLPPLLAWWQPESNSGQVLSWKDDENKWPISKLWYPMLHPCFNRGVVGMGRNWASNWIPEAISAKLAKFSWSVGTSKQLRWKADSSFWKFRYRFFSVPLCPMELTPTRGSHPLQV